MTVVNAPSNFAATKSATPRKIAEFVRPTVDRASQPNFAATNNAIMVRIAIVVQTIAVFVGTRFQVVPTKFATVMKTVKHAQTTVDNASQANFAVTSNVPVKKIVKIAKPTVALVQSEWKLPAFLVNNAATSNAPVKKTAIPVPETAASVCRFVVINNVTATKIVPIAIRIADNVPVNVVISNVKMVKTVVTVPMTAANALLSVATKSVLLMKIVKNVPRIVANVPVNAGINNAIKMKIV